MGALVFVTKELSPFSSGGIGRVIHNILKEMSPKDRARSVVLMVGSSISQSSFKAIFPTVKLVEVSYEGAPFDDEEEDKIPVQEAYRENSFYWQSVCIYRALHELSEEVDIEYVEFADWGGPGFVSIQQKKLTGFLQSATLAIRLHASHTALLSAETYHGTNRNDLHISDLERKSLRDCDMIVAQLKPLVDKIRQIFGFSKAEWDPRVVVHVPPVLLDSEGTAKQSCPSNLSQDLLFISKIQPIKRPDLFVRGSAAFIQAHPTYKGSAIFCAHSFEERYKQAAESLIPPHLNKHFQFSPRLSHQERASLIRKSVSIIPSSFESFCLAAYEASLLGSRVILNASNPAFGEDTPWKDGVNCFKFDGTARGLAHCLDRCFKESPPLKTVLIPKDPWPWTYVEKKPLWKSGGIGPLVSVVIPHFNQGLLLAHTLESIVRDPYLNLEIILIDDGSTQSESQDIIRALTLKAGKKFQVIKLAGSLGISGALNEGVRRSSGKYILPLLPGDGVAPHFVTQAVEALENTSQFSAVIPQAGYLNSMIEGVTGVRKEDLSRHDIFVGEAFVSGFSENNFGPLTALIRKDDLLEVPYDEDLFDLEAWALYLKMIEAGKRFIVDCRVGLYQRPTHKPQLFSRERRIAYYDLIRTSSPKVLREGSRVLAFTVLPSLFHEEIRTEIQQNIPIDEHNIEHIKEVRKELYAIIEEQKKQLDMYQKSASVLTAIKLSRAVNKHAPFLKKPAGKVLQQGWKMIKWVRSHLSSKDIQHLGPPKEIRLNRMLENVYSDLDQLKEGLNRARDNISRIKEDTSSL